MLGLRPGQREQPSWAFPESLRHAKWTFRPVANPFLPSFPFPFRDLRQPRKMEIERGGWGGKRLCKVGGGESWSFLSATPEGVRLAYAGADLPVPGDPTGR